MLKVAVAKGKGVEELFEIFRRVGEIAIPQGRELEVKTKNAVFWYVKPFDVPLWVERRVADIGFVGMDVLKEVGADLLTFFDTGAGHCRISLAGPPEFQEKIWKLTKVKVATKYPNLARKYLVEVFPDFEIIHLSGSVELAPLSGLSDLILDLVSTGRTLKENNLVEIRKFENFSIWVVGNKDSYVLKFEEIANFLAKIAEGLGKKKIADFLRSGIRFFRSV